MVEGLRCAFQLLLELAIFSEKLSLPFDTKGISLVREVISKYFDKLLGIVSSVEGDKYATGKLPFAVAAAKTKNSFS